MLRARRLLMVAGLMGALAPPAVAQTASPAPLFAEFERLCLDTRADEAAVAAGVKDWTPVRDLPRVAVQMMGSPTKKVKAWTKPGPEDEEEVMLVRGVKAIEGAVDARICSIQGPYDAQGDAALRRWAGQPPRKPGDETAGLYVAVETARGRVPLPEATEAERSDITRMRHLIVVHMGEEATIFVQMLPDMPLKPAG